MSLDSTVQELFKAGLAPATLKVYKTGSNRYHSFCVMYNVHNPFPAREDTLLRFVAHLYRGGLKAGTIKSYLAAIRHAQIALGLGNPHMENMSQLEYVVRGVKRLTNRPVRTRLPITFDLLGRLRQAWYAGLREHDAMMLWAAAATCFFGFLRMGEVVIPSDSSFDPSVHPTAADVNVDSHASPSYLAIRIKASKTDPFRQGVTIYLGRTNYKLCPVASVLSYLVKRGRTPGPLFIFDDGRYLTRDRFVKAVREALDAAGVDASKYAGHSFRIGAATTAACNGIQDSLIRTMGRWESSAYTLYIRTPRDRIYAVAASLVGPGAPKAAKADRLPANRRS